MEHQTQILFVMIGYLALLILWGLYQGRKVKTDSDYATSENGIFAAADAATGASLVVHALYHGRQAAQAINGYLK